MPEPLFDPGAFFQFDLANGAVRARDGARVLVLSQSVLAPLIATAVQNGDLTAVRALGNQLGESVAGSLGQGAMDRSPETVLGHAANLIALYGWGRLHLERWGSALVLVVDELPPLDDDNLAVAALLGGMFSTLSDQEVACVPIGETNAYLMVDPQIAEYVWSWSKDGESLGQIISRLQSADSSENAESSS
jgi:hypothetical protein